MVLLQQRVSENSPTEEQEEEIKVQYCLADSPERYLLGKKGKFATAMCLSLFPMFLMVRPSSDSRFRAPFISVGPHRPMQLQVAAATATLDRHFLFCRINTDGGGGDCFACEREKLSPINIEQPKVLG